MTTQHTPGPWENLEHFSESKHDGHLIVGPSGWGIAKIWHDDRLPAGEIDANARLIAAAPELFAFARAFVASGGRVADASERANLTLIASAAITKATGQA